MISFIVHHHRHHHPHPKLSTMNIPLVNEYKIPFILHRISQTFFGGLDLNPEPCSLQSFLKLLIFIIPGVIGILLTILVDFQYVSDYVAMIIGGSCNFLFISMIHCVSTIQREQANVFNTVMGTLKPKTNSCEFTLSSSMSSSFMMIAHQQSLVFILLNSTIGSIMIGIMIYVIRPSLMSIDFSGNHLINLILFTMSWFTFIVAHHSLTIGPAPETAAYSMTFTKMDTFNRPVHLLICLSAIVALSSLHIRQLFLAIICLLPFLWLLGMIPPIQSSFHHLLEQINTWLLGGTASCSLISLSFTVIIGISFIIMNHLFQHKSEPFFITCSVVAFLISNKWYHNWRTMIGTPFQLVKTIILLIGTISIFFIPKSVLKTPSQLLIMIEFLLVSIIIIVKHCQRVYLFGLIKNPLSVCNSSSNIGCMKMKFKKINYLLVIIIRFIIYLG